MGVYLVVFDNPAQDYGRYQAFLDRFDAMRFSDTAYTVQTELSADALYRELEPLRSGDDIAYVIALCQPWIGFGYEAMNDWLKRHL